MTQVIDGLKRETPKIRTPIKFMRYIDLHGVAKADMKPSEFSVIIRIAVYETYDVFICQKERDLTTQWMFFGHWNDGFIKEQSDDIPES